MKYLISIIFIIIAIVVTYIVTPRPFIVHHHANFATYIDGKKWDFSSYVYMEEVSRCNVTQGVTPEDRIHLHNGKGGLVHIHMAASTWGDLFGNLYWGIGNGYVQTDRNNFYKTDDTHHLYYILNGSGVINPANIPVGSTDRLLVWYGTGTEEDIIKKWDILVDNDATEYNKKSDPASCSANTYGGILGAMSEWINTVIGHDD